jgi:glutamate-1-semialdehyde 2,1-aminomutase
MDGPILTADEKLRARSRKVIPGGMYGHLNAAGLPKGYPQFFARGEGCRLWDVDGREYVDLMCSWGPNILGHKHPAVEAAARRQAELGDCLNGPTERMVELAERLTQLVTHADWALFAKNGTDATTTAVTLARAATGRRKILLARGAYHGAIPWCTPYPFGVTAEDRAHVIYFTYNNIESLEAAAASAEGDLAGILVSAFRHDFGLDQELPDRAFAEKARELADAAGAALILDEVRAGFRLSLHGSWDHLGVQPDLAAWSKALANGYAIAAVTGCERLREAASKLYVTGSFWSAGVSMAASLATLEVLEKEDAPTRMRAMGLRFREGVAEQAKRHGVGIRQSGPPQLPTILFDGDQNWEKGSRFTLEALRHGAYLHPKHNMFFSLAHKERDVDFVLEATEKAFKAIATM